MSEATGQPRPSLTSGMLWFAGGAGVGAVLLFLATSRGWLSSGQAWWLAFAVPPGLIAVELLRWGIVRGRAWRALLWPKDLDLGTRRWILVTAREKGTPAAG